MSWLERLSLSISLYCLDNEICAINREIAQIQNLRDELRALEYERELISTDLRGGLNGTRIL